MIAYVRSHGSKMVHIAHESSGQVSAYTLCGCRRGKWVVTHDTGKCALCPQCAVKLAQSPAMRATLQAVVVGIDKLKQARGA